MRLVPILAWLSLAPAIAASQVSGCQRPDATPVAPDGDARMLLDSGDTSPCGRMCANLERVACNPTANCVYACDAAIRDHLIVPNLDCQTKATTRDAVIACGGGFCR